MTKEILIILACVPLYIINSFCDKYISARSANKNSHLYNCIKFFVGSLCLLPVFLSDGAPRFKLGAILCGVACGIMYAVNKTVIMKGYEASSVAFMTLCHASGMIIPCVIGHFLWSEPLSFLSVVGILLTVVSIVLLKDSNGNKKSLGMTGILIGITVFLTSGGVMILQKLMGLYFAEQSVSAYNLYSFVVAFFILCFFVRPKAVVKKDMRAVIPCAVGSAISLCVISLIMTSLAGRVPSIILFPLFNGLGIISVCIGFSFAFKEKLTAKKIIGLVLGICGLCCVNL